jgi:hypothetical protein
MQRTHFIFDLIKGRANTNLFRCKTNKIGTTMLHLKKTTTIGEISPEAKRPTIQLPAHPKVARHNKNGAFA